jgi:tetratricopeptide (TPR) repeat protein
MLKLLGLLLILNSLAVSAWWLSQGKPWHTGVTTISILACLVGLALVFNERAIELSSGKFGKIKTVAQQAETDAKEIALIRKRVESQAAAVDLIAKETTDAKKLVADLTEQNRRAEEKLKKLAENTSDEVIHLPDGRTKVGKIITGQPSLLLKKFEKAIASYQKKDFKSAFDDVSECVKMYEESRGQELDAVTISGALTKDSLNKLYYIAAMTAQNIGEYDLSLKWAKKAVDIKPTPKVKALLVTCYLNKNMTAEANQLVNEMLNKNNDESRLFKKILIKSGVPINQRNKHNDSGKQ